MISARAVAIAAAVFVVACTGDPTTTKLAPTDGVLLTVVSGNGQSGPPGAELANALAASVTDSRGHAIVGQLVNFRVVSGGGSMFGGASISDKTGMVRDYWTLGQSGAQSVEVRAVDPTTGQKLTFATFTATFSTPPDADGDGYTIAQGDCNDNDPTIHPGAADDPDPGFVDSNCDGIDGTKTTAVFVAKTGTDASGCGDFGSPCLTIAFGTTRAKTLGRSSVYIGVGTYAESVVLSNGISLYGGYSSDFATRSLANRATISGSAAYGSGGITYAVVGENLIQPTSVVGLLIAASSAAGQQADGSGKHSVGVLVRNVPAGVLTIAYSRITAGAGSPGLGGPAGTAASQTVPASGGNGGTGAQLSAQCDNTTHASGGTGAGAGNSQGGAGGAGGTMDTACDFDPFNLNVDYTATAGVTGSAATLSGAGFGTGGAGGAGASLCGAGLNGVNGHRVDGTNGAGGGSAAQFSGFLIIAAGIDGQLGSDGTGGGGGGGGGGCDIGIDSYGSGGGGGGSGGVKAPIAGTAGHGGGASVAIYLSNANATLSNLELVRGNGGAGGAGGGGAKGGPGSLGGLGGPAPGDGGAGGNGGAGGDGGYSGAGGGAAGGSSIGILKIGTSATVETSITVSLGTGGGGGAGGARGDGTSASAGAAGALLSSVVIP